MYILLYCVLKGEYIDSVLPSEIEVTIQEEVCAIQSITASVSTLSLL